MTFAHILLQWFEENKRKLPWRNETDPYKIWVSEVILQQTRVVQGIDYYHNFIAHFPNVNALAAAPESEVLKVWQGLGYYSRARNMHVAAQTIANEHLGIFPHHYDEIRKLKGIGDYTAAAIASIAFNLPYPAIDGNVLRFISRYFGIFDNIALKKTRKFIVEKCRTLILPDEAGTFNQAMMEMGATQCTPQHPHCENCPFQSSCFASIHQQVENLPFKQHNITIKNRYFNYLFFIHQQKTVIQQRTANDIWNNLYELPLVETPTAEFDIHSFIQQQNIVCEDDPKMAWETKHILTHRNIFAKFFVLPVTKIPKLTQNQIVIDLKDFKKFPVAKITERFMMRLGELKSNITII